MAKNRITNGFVEREYQEFLDMVQDNKKLFCFMLYPEKEKISFNILLSDEFKFTPRIVPKQFERWRASGGVNNLCMYFERLFRSSMVKKVGRVKLTLLEILRDGRPEDGSEFRELPEHMDLPMIVGDFCKPIKGAIFPDTTILNYGYLDAEAQPDGDVLLYLHDMNIINSRNLTGRYSLHNLSLAGMDSPYPSGKKDPWGRETFHTLIMTKVSS